MEVYPFTKTVSNPKESKFNISQRWTFICNLKHLFVVSNIPWVIRKRLPNLLDQKLKSILYQPRNSLIFKSLQFQP